MTQLGQQGPRAVAPSFWSSQAWLLGKGQKVSWAYPWQCPGLLVTASLLLPGSQLQGLHLGLEL